MSRIAYVNGRYVPHREAVVHVEDRGYQFADAVYEVIGIVDNRNFSPSKKRAQADSMAKSFLVAVVPIADK